MSGFEIFMVVIISISFVTSIYWFTKLAISGRFDDDDDRPEFKVNYAKIKQMEEWHRGWVNGCIDKSCVASYDRYADYERDARIHFHMNGRVHERARVADTVTKNNRFGMVHVWVGDTTTLSDAVDDAIDFNAHLINRISKELMNNKGKK
jgi:hypothetical protein